MDKLVSLSCERCVAMVFPPPPSQDQYKLCHEVLLAYVDTFDTYSNFNEAAKV